MTSQQEDIIRDKVPTSVPLLCLLLVIATITTATAWAVTAGQIDDFEDGTTQNWEQGETLPDSPRNVGSGGPGGAGDSYLQDASDGVEEGGRLVMFNEEQWADEYTSAGVEVIALEMINEGSNPLTMRLAIDGDGGQFSTISEVALPVGSGWQTAYFDVRPDNWVSVGGSSITATLSNADTLRLLHNADPDWRGTDIVATIGVDNITAGPIDFANLGDAYGHAWHTLGSQRLGTAVDADVGPAADANDGVTRDTATAWQPGDTVSITVTVFNAGSNLVAWMDWNGDGTFDNSTPERVISQTVAAASNHLTFTVPSGAGYSRGDPLNARFRIADAPIENPRPVGPGRGGEVEDYAWNFSVLDHDVYVPIISR